jgi:hypothetical protein
MSERNTFNYGKLVKILAFVVIPAVLISSLLVYGRLYGLRQALEELVRTQTDNQYTLSIGKTEIELRSLSFKFRDVKVARNQSDTTSGVKFASVPELDLKLGSFSSLFSKEMDISLLAAYDPEIILLSGQHQVERSMITKQVIDLYPVIEAILSGFNIQSLKVSDATLRFLQNDNDIFSIRYVDLDIQDWRMRELSNTSQLRISIEKQNLNLGKANLNFSGIEYNYLKHHLMFTDFSVSAADSASGSNISISGKALKLNNLDYAELYKNLRYNLERVEIVEPVITAKFQWKSGRRSKEIDRNIVTRMVKQTIGECNLDSAIITKARVHVQLRQEDDTVSINLPRVDFRLHTFAVVKDSTNFQIGEMHVNLNGSAITLPNNWSVELDNVLYDHHRDLTLNKITIRHVLEPAPIATLTTLRVRYFNLIDLIFHRRFSAWTIHAEGGHVNVHRFTRSTANADSSLRAPVILVHTLSLKDIDLTYRSRKASVEVKGLSFRATGIRTRDDGTILYQLKSVSADGASINDNVNGIQATLRQVAFNGQKFNAGHIRAIKDSLTVVADHFETEIPGTSYRFQSLKYVAADRLTLHGRVPAANATGQKQAFNVGRLDLGAVQVNVVQGTTHVTFGARNVRTDRWQFGAAPVWPRHVSGEFSDLTVKAGRNDVRVAQLMVDYPRRVTGTSIRFDNSQLKLSAFIAVARRPDHQHGWTFERLLMGEVHVSTATRTLDADSVAILTARFANNEPHAERIDIYKPVALLGPAPAASGAEQPRLLDALPARHLYLHPGELTLPNSHKVAFGLVHADRDKHVVRASYVSTSLKKMNLMVRNATLEPNRLTFDSVLMIPNRKWFSSLEVEETQILARFGQVSVREFYLEQYLRHRTADKLDLDIGYADFDLRRNKLLPDPPPYKKPVTLDGIIPLPENVQVSTINIHDGRLQYRQISDKTGEEGYVMMDKIVAVSHFDTLSSFISLRARASLYQSGVVELNYKTLAQDQFRLDILVRDMDLTKLNQIVMPLQSLRIKSGYLKEYKLSVHADDDAATGQASISYDGLHLELFKHDEPERKSLGTEVLTLLADGIILKHSKENAQAAVTHQRVKYKSVFHYWVTSAIQGATGAIRKGKRQK